MSKLSASLRHPLIWVPTLYLAMGIPYNVINGTATRMYKSLGYADSMITVALGSIGVAWSLKPLWAAFLDMYRTKRFFVLTMEILLALLFAAIAMTLPLGGFFQVSIALLWVAAFASSTQDICGDGLYLTSLEGKQQGALAGIQGMFWILGKVLATGALIIVMDRLANANAWSQTKMWSMVWMVSAAVMVLLALYHFFFLPPGSTSQRVGSSKQVLADFAHTATTFFYKRAFWGMIAFVFLYRLGEGLILMEGQLFLQSSVEQGGLGLSAAKVSEIDAIWGTIASIIGGLLGGVFLSRIGLMRALPFLGLCLNIPHFTFVYLSQYAAARHGLDVNIVITMVSLEKFGYGFGFVGNMVYMMQQLAPGRSSMTHYAFATALMNLMLVPTAMISGPLAETLGFSTFFVVVMFASVPSVWAAWKAPFPNKASEFTKESITDSAGNKSELVLTPDDPSRLTVSERIVQGLAGRASIYAMLHILAILVIDSQLLGELQTRGTSPGTLAFSLLLVNFGLKLFLSWRCWTLARDAFNAADTQGEQTYRGNAKGARIVTALCLVAGIVILVVAYRLAV